MKGFILVDTLYLNVKYPKRDVFDRFYSKVEHVNYRNLKSGVPVDQFVVRTGGSGYKISIWQNDARLFLTDQVDDVLGNESGMGIWVQLGPKYLIDNFSHIQSAVKLLLENAGIFGDYPISITRIDIAVDLIDESLQNQNTEFWRQNWVGRSNVSSIFFSTNGKAIETINIGRRSASVFLRIYDKLAQAIKEGDILYWLDVWGVEVKAVTRVEWQVSPGEGGFTIHDFQNLNGAHVKD